MEFPVIEPTVGTRVDFAIIWEMSRQFILWPHATSALAMKLVMSSG